VKVEFTAPALLELEAIAEWIAQDNPARAYAFVNELEKACLDIGRRPASYPYFDRRRVHGVRRRGYGNYLIFYREGPDGVQILHVLHGARDYAWIVIADDELA
jgi:toxin ParE1/3/4